MKSVINKKLNSNQYAISPSIEDINKIYERELFRYRSMHYDRGFYIFLVLGVFFVFFAISTEATINYILIAVAICFFGLAYSAFSSKKRSIEILKMIKNGYFKVIHTYVTKICEHDNELNTVQCEVAHDKTIKWWVDNHDVKIGSPIIIAFDDNDWCKSYLEYSLSDEGIYVNPLN